MSTLCQHQYAVFDLMTFDILS